jgi:hypothetical protein
MNLLTQRMRFASKKAAVCFLLSGLLLLLGIGALLAQERSRSSAPNQGYHGNEGDPEPPLPTIQFEFANYHAEERSKSAHVTVTLSDKSADTVTVDYATSDGTATAGEDYAPKSGTLTFAPGETTQSFAVTLYKDLKVESDESVKLTLSKAVNADLTQPTATLNILDNPPVIKFHKGKSANGIAPPSKGPVVASGEIHFGPVQFAICSGGIASYPHQATLTAYVYDGYDPWVGITVNFATDRGSVSPSSVTTDANGWAPTVLTSNGTASENPTIYNATVTANAEGASGDTYIMEFQAPDISLTASYSELVTGETTCLLAALTWNYQPIDSHSLGWRISRIWDVDSKLIYDGTGMLPSGYGSIQSGASTQTDSSGNGKAVYESGANGGTVELEVADLTVSLCDSEGNPKAAQQANVVKPILTIKRQTAGAGGYKYINLFNGNTSLLPGELVDLQMVLDVAPKGGPDGVVWSRTGTTFGGYSANADTASVTPIGDVWDTIQFRRVNSGDITLGAGYKIGSQWIEASGTLTVATLKTIEFSTVLGTAGITADKKNIGLGDLAAGKPGITFNGKVETPAGMSTGTWQFVQKIQYERFYTKSDGTKYKWSINDQFVFDTDATLAYPYAGPFAADGKQQSTNDSPAQPLVGTVTAYSAKKELFEMYIMFKSDQTNAHWVPLMVVNWNWSAAATQGVGGWALDDGSAGQYADANGKATTTHPVWTRNSQKPAPSWQPQ